MKQLPEVLKAFARRVSKDLNMGPPDFEDCIEEVLLGGSDFRFAWYIISPNDYMFRLYPLSGQVEYIYADGEITPDLTFTGPDSEIWVELEIFNESGELIWKNPRVCYSTFITAMNSF